MKADENNPYYTYGCYVGNYLGTKVLIDSNMPKNYIAFCGKDKQGNLAVELIKIKNGTTD